MRISKLNATIEAGINFITGQGEEILVSDSSPAQEPWQPDYTYQTCFVPSLILQSLSQLKAPKLERLRQELFDFIVQQQSDKWSFNYWARLSPEAKTLPYPDDLDDTFSALIGLFMHDPEYIYQAGLPQIVSLLLATETVAGGPYRTWLTANDDPKWQDVDLATNANVACFLKLINSQTPQLQEYIANQIKTGQLTSVYYPSPFPIIYYLARVCPAQSQKTLLVSIKSLRPRNALQNALSLQALCLLASKDSSVKLLADKLGRLQSPDGSWPAAAFCLDPARGGKSYYHGSASLTTAFALEALQTYKRLSAINTEDTNNTADAALNNITRLAKHDIASLAPAMKPVARRMLASMNLPKIVLLPHLFARGLKITPQTNLDAPLGLANLYGWMAYTIYDDFLDEEGQLQQLPLANWAMRQSLNYFKKVDDQQFLQTTIQAFDTIDAANAWEISHCRWHVIDGILQVGRLPNYQKRQNLADRSIGHSLTPLAILASCGQPLDEPSVKSIRQAFNHYLIARQLDDDAHDWQADVSKGHISYVVAAILADIDYSVDMPIKQLIPIMRQQFWHHSLVKICADMQIHIKQGQAELQNNPLLKKDNILPQLLDGLESSVKLTLNKQKQATNFLAHYQKVR
ncbi:MAG: hypothetical protein ABIQ89_02380 [Candidatus Saccharimonadales bacterium]